MHPSPVPRSAVVVGVDPTPASLEAIDWAAREAARRGRPLHILHAFTIAQLATPGPDGAVADFEDVTMDSVHRARLAYPDLKVTFSEPEYGPASALIDASRIAELVVVGSRGHGTMRSAVTGTTSVHVAAEAACPVVVIREGTTPRPVRGQVVVGVDGSEISRQAVRVAFDQAAARGVALVAVHAWNILADGVAAGQSMALSNRDEVSEQAHADVAESLAGYAEDYPDVPVERIIVEGYPVDVLADQSREAQLLVVGSRGRGLVRGFLLGSVSQGVMHRATCPVLIVKDRGTRDVDHGSSHVAAAAG